MKKIPKDLENYSFWIKANDFLMGPSLILASSVIICFVAATIVTLAKPGLIAEYMRYYYALFPLFIISLWLAFTGVLLKESGEVR
jgi:hypothetical protein